MKRYCQQCGKHLEFRARICTIKFEGKLFCNNKCHNAYHIENGGWL